MDEDRLQFWSLYLARFAEGFGFVTLITLLPYYINALEPTDTTILGLTIGAGLVVGLYTTGFTLAQTIAVVPLAWAGDRFDKRLVLLSVLGAGVGVYALFPIVDSSASFIAIRALQGVAVTGTGLMTLSLVGHPLRSVRVRSDLHDHRRYHARRVARNAPIVKGLSRPTQRSSGIA